MRHKITVTQDDINRGKRGIGESCPIAKAIRRKLKIRKVHVDISYVDTQYAQDIPLPLPAKTFINHFDRHIAVKPFSFTINIPKE